MAVFHNYLIESIPTVERLKLLGLCEKFPLIRSEVLWQQNELASHVYFPVQGLISLMAVQESSASLEIALIGNEGMLGTRMALGVVDSPSRAVVQAEGWA